MKFSGEVASFVVPGGWAGLSMVVEGNDAGGVNEKTAFHGDVEVGGGIGHEGDCEEGDVAEFADDVVGAGFGFGRVVGLGEFVAFAGVDED